MTDTFFPRRFGAFALDYLVLYPIHLMTSPFGLNAFQGGGATGFLGAMLLPQLTWFLYFFISEKYLGRSVGKWLRTGSAPAGPLPGWRCGRCCWMWRRSWMLSSGARAATDRIISGISKGVAYSLATMLGVLSIPAVILSVFLRGGLLLRLFGMAVRTRDGGCAPRSRCALRALASWGPFLPYMPLPGLFFGAGSLDKPVLALLPLAIGTVGLIVIALRPARSIPDLIAGTVLVPR